MSWLRGRGFELIEVSAEDAFQLGANAISLGDERVLSVASAASLNAAMRARGLTVHELDLSMFTLGGGGAHCLAQALRRERLAADGAPAIDAGRVIADLRELDRRTGGPDGARRLCWGEEWRAARSLLAELLAELGLEAERDEAGNLWA